MRKEAQSSWTIPMWPCLKEGREENELVRFSNRFLLTGMGSEREAWRQYREELRHYDAGDYGRLNARWYATNSSGEMTDRMYRSTVRARARDLERNSDIMNSVTGAYKRNVIGSGFQLQANTGNQKKNKELEDLWNRWCKARNCDVTGTQSLNQILRMAVVRKKVDGGILFVKRYTKEGIAPFQLQMMEVDELDTMINTSEGQKIESSEELNITSTTSRWLITSGNTVSMDSVLERP